MKKMKNENESMLKLGDRSLAFFFGKALVDIASRCQVISPRLWALSYMHRLQMRAYVSFRTLCYCIGELTFKTIQDTEGFASQHVTRTLSVQPVGKTCRVLSRFKGSASIYK